jgi:hypothetical protein
VPLSEKATRKQLIDAALPSSGWEPIRRAETERQGGPVVSEDIQPICEQWPMNHIEIIDVNRT